MEGRGSFIKKWPVWQRSAQRSIDLATKLVSRDSSRCNTPRTAISQNNMITRIKIQYKSACERYGYNMYIIVVCCNYTFFIWLNIIDLAPDLWRILHTPCIWMGDPEHGVWILPHSRFPYSNTWSWVWSFKCGLLSNRQKFGAKPPNSWRLL